MTEQRPEQEIARHYLIEGRVQGVWYRGNCREQALRLGLRGWVRNLADGRVEAVACGNRESLRALEDWLWQGPPLAEVESVVIKVAEVEAWESFDIVATPSRQLG